MPEEQAAPEEQETGKREKKEKSKNLGKSRGKLILWLVLGIVLLVAVLVTLAWIFNPMGMRDRVKNGAEGLMKRIPVVRNLVTAPPEEDEEETIDMEEIQAEIDGLQAMVDERDRLIENMQSNAAMKDDEIAQLRSVAIRYEDWRADKEAFDRMIAEHDPRAYANFYESIDPLNAEILYPRAAASADYEAAMKKYIREFEAMDEKKVAAILEEMILADMDLVVLILENMDYENAGGVLGEMSPQNASAVSRRRAQDNNFTQ